VLGRGVNLAVWTWDDSAFAWLATELTTERLTELVPGLVGVELRRYLLPNLRAVNLVARPRRGSGLEAGLGSDLAAARLEIPGELLEVGPCPGRRRHPARRRRNSPCAAQLHLPDLARRGPRDRPDQHDVPRPLRCGEPRGSELQDGIAELV